MTIQLRGPKSSWIFTREEVHIWLASLDIPALKYRALLTSDEQKRAERFRFERERRRFTVRRGILRTLSSNYLGIEPKSIRFTYGKKGKPEIAPELNKAGIHFNSSSSGDMAIYIFSEGHEVGVDIEQIREIKGMAQLVERFFSARERAQWCALPEYQKKEAFFNGWTRKEAFIKATGDGLSYRLDRFDVSLAPGEPANLLAIEGNTDTASQWSINDLKTAPGFAGALAIKGRLNKINIRQWPE